MTNPDGSPPLPSIPRAANAVDRDREGERMCDVGAEHRLERLNNERGHPRAKCSCGWGGERGYWVEEWTRHEKSQASHGMTAWWKRRRSKSP